ncbi:MAG: alpha/beta hydrolase [Clostridiales bacterium]|jgi:acetyl esterase/lipase|nr:alpha/beta hydrolase [Clostridiales bacterium]
MTTEEVDFSEDGRIGMTVYLHDVSSEMSYNDKRPAMLVFPGGAYRFLSDRENEPVALKYFAEGYNCFVLRYSVNEYARDYQPLREAALAVKTVRKFADEWNVLPDKIAVVGFSAGGHLAASLAVMWDGPIVNDLLDPGEEPEIFRPDAVVLSYALISSKTAAIHDDSFNTLFNGDKSRYHELSLENKVSDNTPPVFLWTTYDDMTVPVLNSLLFASAMAEAKRPFELHVFEKGPHGLSLCTEETGMVESRAKDWFNMSVEWLKLRFG